MRNRALDGSADRTDLVVVFVFTRIEFTILWLLSRRDVARPLKSLVCDNRSGKVENLLYLAFPLLHVMVTSGSRVRDEDNVPEFVADNQAAKLRAVVVNGDLDDYMNYYKNRYRDEHHLARYDEDTIDRLNLAA